MSSVDANLRLLIVEDSEDDLLLMVREIRRGGYQVDYKRVESEAEMRQALAGEDWDMIIADYTMPHFSGLAALDVLRDTGLDIPIVIVSGTITDETAVAAMRSGAKDYLMKDNLRRLVPVLEREISERQERAARRRVEESLKQHEEEEQRMKKESEEATKKFLRDTLYAVTDGRLSLVSYEEAQLLSPEANLRTEMECSARIESIRTEVKSVAQGMNMPEDRVHALVIAVGEASTNAMKHAGGGTVSIYCIGDKIRVGIRDYGEGIESLILPKATLMTRFSTEHSMGFGYALMLASVDAVYLATGRQGTWVILEQAVESMTSELSLAQLPDVW